ncbi:hypothetical protein EJ08DRAFT_528482 [Tothia fuscella]|uniref:Uncharacterized protein n=1 Tax=Tothia fuscella TaxID=1048955 RepID=A0A9P4TSP2_9PEZI|nr:hypothetical protein EJ08DRAFT_528482 [Tothia fuscella]
MLAVQEHQRLEQTTAVSFLIILLHGKLVENNVLVLSLYCGLHTESVFAGPNVESGPLTMAEALLARVVKSESIDWELGSGGFRFLNIEPENVSRMKMDSSSAYLRLLTDFIGRLRCSHVAIFLVIDSLHWDDLNCASKDQSHDQDFLSHDG